jgi:predicted small lipoprotein YifL
MKKTSWIIFLSLLVVTSCGRKGPLSHPKDEQRPKFDKVIDEEPNLELPNIKTVKKPTPLPRI